MSFMVCGFVWFDLEWNWVRLSDMSTVEEIVNAIGELPREEFWKLTDRIVAQREKVWDEEVARDASTGQLDALWRQAEAEIEAGEAIPLDGFLRHKEVSR
jgi:hypothetical protein